MQRIVLPDGRDIHFQTATPNDVQPILQLYEKVYKGHYTLEDVTVEEEVRKRVDNPNYFWPLAHVEGNVVGSVLFAVDPVNKLGKAYAGAVLNEFRGQEVMHTMLLQGLERLTRRTRTCDVIYGTTRTVSKAPQKMVEHLGFHPLGIFPNVRKVESFETHGLEVYLTEHGQKIRRPRPRLIPEVREFYRIVRENLGFEESEEVGLPLADPRKMGDSVTFSVEKDVRAVNRKFDEYQDKDLMDKVFFPFTEPNLLFRSEDGKAEIFVNFNDLDGNGMIIGYRISHPDLRRILMWFCESAAAFGMRYIELLVSAFKPEFQRVACDARFLPCAYFPSMRMCDDGLREDYIVFSRSFEALDFMDLHLMGVNRRFLDAFMKCWYELLVRCQPDFDDGGWRIG